MTDPHKAAKDAAQSIKRFGQAYRAFERERQRRSRYEVKAWPHIEDGYREATLERARQRRG